MLLPLDLQLEDGAAEALATNPIAELLAVLPASLDQGLLNAVADASARGEDAVTRALGRRLGDVLVVEGAA